MSETFVAMYRDFDTARQAVEALVSSGISRDKISLVANDTTTGYSKNLQSSDQVGGADGDVEAPEGAGFGAVIGTLIGLGSVLIPGVGPVIGAGTLGAAALAAGIGAASGAVTGGLAASMIDMGIPEEDAHAYSEGIRRGGAMVSVVVDSGEEDRVESILNRYSPIDLDQQAQHFKQTGWSGGYNPNSTTLGHEEITREREQFRTIEAGDEATLEVVEEELQVGKRDVERGRMRVRTYVTETPVQEQVTLREEHVKIERRPVNRAATAADLNAFQEGVIEVTEHAEEAVVSKQARVVEEVVIGKEVEQHTETINDTVRRVDVDVENTATAGRGWETYDTSYRNHFNTNYGSSGYTYDQYMPAYRYGYDLRNSSKYRGRQWNEIESDVRTNWESKNPNSWENFKGSIRHAWDSVTDNK